MHVPFINLFSGCIENFDAANSRLDPLGKPDMHFVRHRLHSSANSPVRHDRRTHAALETRNVRVNSQFNRLFQSYQKNRRQNFASSVELNIVNRSRQFGGELPQQRLIALTVEMLLSEQRGTAEEKQTTKKLKFRAARAPESLCKR